MPDATFWMRACSTSKLCQLEPRGASSIKIIHQLILCSTIVNLQPTLCSECKAWVFCWLGTSNCLWVLLLASASSKW